MNRTEWLDTAVFYNIYPQSFYDTNGDGIGDLQGVTDKLDYIEYMGYNALWLNPFYESPFRDAGYDVTDFYKVAPRYGTNDDFVELCERAHDKGIKVCIDLVAGHTSTECEWFRQSCRAERNEYSNRYIWTDSWTNNYRNLCIGGMAERDGNYMRNFFYCQPALNYGFEEIDEPSWQLPMDHPDCVATRRELMNIMEFWMGLGCDGFRVDMASSLVKNDEKGTGLKKLWGEIRAMMDEKWPDHVLISEWSCPHKAINSGFDIDFMIHFGSPAYTKLFRAERGRNTGDDYLGHSFFNADGNGNIDEFLIEYLHERESTRDRGYISIPTGNHDMPRLAMGRSMDEMKLAFAFLMMLPGVPFVYYGDEIAMPYVADLRSKEGGYNRTGARTPMQWSRGRNAGFSTGRSENLYLPVDENGVNVEDQMKDDDSLLNCVRNLIALRKSSRALCADGEFEVVNRRHGGYPLIFRRYSDSEEYLVCINPTDTEMEWKTGCSDASVIMKNGEVSLDGDKVSLGAASFMILRTR